MIVLYRILLLSAFQTFICLYYASDCKQKSPDYQYFRTGNECETDRQIRYQRNTDMSDIEAATELRESETMAQVNEMTYRN